MFDRGLELEMIKLFVFGRGAATIAVQQAEMNHKLQVTENRCEKRRIIDMGFKEVKWKN